MNEEGNPSLLSEILAGAVIILVGIGGFFSKTIMGTSTDLAVIKKDLEDLRDTVQRMHQEGLLRHAEFLHRLDLLEARACGIDDLKKPQ